MGKEKQKSREYLISLKEWKYSRELIEVEYAREDIRDEVPRLYRVVRAVSEATVRNAM